MIDPAAFYASLKHNGLTFFTGVPDSLLKDLCAFITDQVPSSDHVINANEGSAVALAAGYHLATGRIPVVYMQNSGTGNAINPLLSLADPAVYAIPMLLLIGWRGEPAVKDEPQHVTQGRVMTELLDAIEMPYDVIDADTVGYDAMLGTIVQAMAADPRPRALLVRKGTFSPHEPVAKPAPERLLTRPLALDVLLGQLAPDDLLISTTGMASREVFAYRERTGQGHDHDFLTVGSMGHCSQIALGIAQRQPSRSVFCLDGDGAMIMHMGSLAIIGSQQPSNLRHVVINNGAHDSVGGQPTAAAVIDIPAVAMACGYRNAAVATSDAEIVQGVAMLRAQPGPALLEIRVASSAHTDAGRPTSTPIENRTGFMRALQLESE